MSNKPRLFNGSSSHFVWIPDLGLTNPRMKGAIEGMHRRIQKMHQADGVKEAADEPTSNVEFSYCSDGRLIISCGDDVIAIPPTDTIHLKEFLSQIHLTKGVGHV